MRTDVREAGPFERLLTVHISESELGEAKRRAARRLSQNLKIKGFRPGKAPLPVVEARIGTEALREEAIEEALPEIVGSVLDDEGLRPATTPRVEDTRATDDGVEVDVKVTLWPTLDRPPIYEDRKITVDRPDVSPEEVDRQIDRIRDQYAELESVARPAAAGDYISVDLSASRHGQMVEEASASDLLYELGSSSFIEGLDDQLTGKSAGDIVRFNTVLPAGFGPAGGQEVTMQVLVKDVRRKVLPDLTDEWVEDVSEFATVEELRENLAEQILAVKRAAARNQYQARLMEDLVEEVDLQIPDALVAAEMDRLLHNFLHQLESQGLDLGTYLQLSNLEQDAFIDDLRRRADRSIRADVLLDSVAEANDLEVSSEDIDRAIGELAEASDQGVDETREALMQGGRVDVLAGDILKRKALDLLVSAAVPVDADGDPVQLDDTEAVPEEGSDGPEVSE